MLFNIHGDAALAPIVELTRSQDVGVRDLARNLLFRRCKDFGLRYEYYTN